MSKLTKQQLLDYAVRAIDDILTLKGVQAEGENAGKRFVGGLRKDEELRKTQREALIAWRTFLTNSKLSVTERLTGFFNIPTGLGKTGPFVKIVAGMHKYALKDGFNLQTRIVFPTVNLLTQTEKKGFGKYAPEMLPHIGHYGDGPKQLDKPITLMTFRAWHILTDEKILNARNTNILVFDEAHRALSERRERSLLKVFNGSTFKPAFTATYAFDQTKTLTRTHKYKIYDKKIGEALKDGELCEFACTQFLSIRVSPEEIERLKEELKGKELSDTDIRLLARQHAWNRRAVKIYTEGTDKYNQPLSDQQAGFYTSNTVHADELEGVLNNNPVLTEKAKKLGCEGVAVAIHSNMSSKQQKKKQEAYEAGKYMAIIGDDKFKEGFDHAPLKVIIKWPTTSLVDESQIIGRAARRWENDGRWFPERKGIQEGMTVVDTVVYIGDLDRDKNEKIRNMALMETVLARDVIGDTFVLRTGAKPRGSGGGGGGGGGARLLFEDDLDVEASVTLEDMMTFVNTKGKLIEDYNFTYTIEDVLESARLEFESTGRRPTIIDERVLYGPLAGKVNWHSVNYAFVRGHLKGHGYTSLAHAFDKNDIGVFSFTDKDILESARLEYGATNRRPNKASHQLIQYGPLKGKISWAGVDLVIRRCSEGKENTWGLKVQDCKSLSTFLDRFAENGEWMIKAGILNFDSIDQSARETLRATGKRPAIKDVVEYGPLKGKTNWSRINCAIKNKKIPGEDYKSLDDFLNKRSVPTGLLTVENVLDSALSTLKAIGKRPSRLSGLIEYGPLNDGKTWGAIDANIARKTNGCEDWDYKNLRDLLDKNNVPKTMDIKKKPKPPESGGGWMMSAFEL